MPSQMSAKHTPWATVNSSPKSVTANTREMVGLTYWMNPITVMEMRLAAPANKSSGTAVRMPQPTSSAIAPAASVTAKGSGVGGRTCQIHGATAAREQRRRAYHAGQKRLERHAGQRRVAAALLHGAVHAEREGQRECDPNLPAVYHHEIPHATAANSVASF